MCWEAKWYKKKLCSNESDENDFGKKKIEKDEVKSDFR